jgi:hypothetical protein
VFVKHCKAASKVPGNDDFGHHVRNSGDSFSLTLLFVFAISEGTVCVVLLPMCAPRSQSVKDAIWHWLPQPD